MASCNDDFPDFQKVPPAYEEPPQQHGCFFYGCLISSILALLLLIAVGVGIFFLYRWVGSVVEEYTATAPRELPKVELPTEDRRSVNERFDAFRAAMEAGRPAEPLVLSGQDLNALIEDRTSLKGKVYVTIEGEKLKGQVSLPASDIIDIGLTRGRYLNGEAEFKVALVNGVLVVTIDSFEVNGQRPSDDFLAQLRGQNVVKDITNDPKQAEEIRRLESIEVKDGKLIIKARARARQPEAGKTGESPRIEPRESKAIARPPESSPAPSGGASKPAEKLPDDVLAPPESRPAGPDKSPSVSPGIL